VVRANGRVLFLGAQLASRKCPVVLEFGQGGRSEMSTWLKNQTCFVYVLRCWRESWLSPDQEPVWHFSLEKIGGERHHQGFKDLDELVAFLREQLGIKNVVKIC